MTEFILAIGALLVAHVISPMPPVRRFLTAFAGWRTHRWAGLPTWLEPLVLVLRCGYAIAPLGFLLVGLSILWPDAIPPSGALHAWTAGAMALMTLAVMTRASLWSYGLSADGIHLNVRDLRRRYRGGLQPDRRIAIAGPHA